MNMFNHVGLISQSDRVKNWQVQIVAAALQTQVSRDFSPIWGVDATVSAFDQLGDLPSGFWPMIIKDDIGFNAGGIHLDKNKKPFGLVSATNNWSLTASHEVLEILADPLGNRTQIALSIIKDQGLVEYLVEVCDPSEAAKYGYQINGVWLSDFYTPEFFLSLSSGNQRYSFTGAISKSLTILQGGYISWMDPATESWWQQTWFEGDEPVIRELGPLDVSQQSPRTVIDTLSMRDRKEPQSLVGLPQNDEILVKQRKIFSAINKATRSRAGALNQTILELIASDGEV
jgi:hypothetical protein